MVDWARQVILQTKRWLPDRHLIVVADASFAAIDLIAALRRHVCLITRLRIDASLFAPAPPRRVGQMGRPRVIPVAISLDLTVPAFAAQSGPRITPKGGVSFYANGYDRAAPANVQSSAG